MIPFIDLARQHAALRGELNAALMRVVDSSHFVLGDEGRALARDLAAQCGVRWALGVASGTDALRLALAAVGVGPGDEVITPAFSFVASATTIAMVGAKLVFVDIDPVTYAMDVDAAARAITSRTRAIMPVHLRPPGADGPDRRAGTRPQARRRRGRRAGGRGCLGRTSDRRLGRRRVPVVLPDQESRRLRRRRHGLDRPSGRRRARREAQAPRRQRALPARGARLLQPAR